MMTATSPRIAYDDAGRGEPAVLFMPGWAVSRSFFGALMELASTRRRALTLDWRGHGGSEPAAADHGTHDLVDDVLRVLDQASVDRVVPVAQAHAGWMALELRRRLGARRIPGLVVMSWMVLGPPPGFGEALAAIRDPARWEIGREALIERWTGGSDDPRVRRQADDMRACPYEIWARAGREIERSFEVEGSPVAALERLESPCPTLHLFAQPADEAFMRAQEEYAAVHPWFEVRRIEGRTHFPALEAPEQVATATEEFLVRAVS